MNELMNECMTGKNDVPIVHKLKEIGTYMTKAGIIDT